MSDVYIDAGAKDNVSKVFKQIGDNTKTLGDSFKSLLVPLAAIGGAFLAIKKMSADFQKAIDMGGRLHELSRQTDESAGNLMVLQRAFQNAGAGAESVGPTLARMNRFIAEAGEGGTKQTEIMNKLGLTMADLADKTPTEQLQLLADRVAGLQSPTERAQVSMDLFGRSGAELVPLFRAMGVELENARNQLGSAPEVADKAAQMFNTLGNNLNAVREKSAEFAFGLLSELLPNLVAVTDRLANIDAAGIGAKLSEYAKATLDWAVETFKLGDALKNAELAFKAITEGNIGDGLKLIFLTMRDTALNAVNEIFANAKAVIETAGHLLMTTLQNTLGNPNLMDALAEAIRLRLGAAIVNVGVAALETIRNTMNALVNSWNFVVNDLSKMLSDTLSKTFNFLASDLGQAITNPIAFAAGKIPLMLAKSSKDAADAVEGNFDIASTKIFSSLETAFTNASADYETKISASNQRIEKEGKAAFQAIGNEAKNSGEVFRASYEANIANPLIEMESRMAETANHAARVRENLQGAAQAMMQISDSAPTLDSPSPTVPSVADIANTVADAFSGGNTPAGGSGGGSSPSGSPAPRQLTNRERALMSPNEKRAADLESKGMFNSADRAREQGERKVEQQRRRDANRELQKDLGLGGSVGKTPEQIAREEGKVNPLNREDFQKRVKEIEDEIQSRAGQGDGTRDTAGGAGGGGKPTESSLEKLVSEIKALVEKIEPKLPTHALA
jgi:dsRNA-specific ribonuclease